MRRSTRASLSTSQRSFWFIGVGITAAAVHLGSVWLFVGGLGIRPTTANVMAFVVAFCVSYAGHRLFTFVDRDARLARSGARWAGVSVAGFCVNQFAYVNALSAFGAEHYLAILTVVTGAVALGSYLLGTFWAFRSREASRQHSPNGASRDQEDGWQERR